MVRHQGRAVDEAVLLFRLLLSHGCAEEKQKTPAHFPTLPFPGDFWAIAALVRSDSRTQGNGELEPTGHREARTEWVRFFFAYVF